MTAQNTYGSGPLELICQKEITLAPRSRGFHIITPDVVRALPELQECRAGLLHLQLLHTSASLTINESADPDVRTDMFNFFKRAVPDGAAYFNHVLEGDDDMTAHILSSLLGQTLTLQAARGYLILGTWQAIYLGEHRSCGGSRRIAATLTGVRA